MGRTAQPGSASVLAVWSACPYAAPQPEVIARPLTESSGRTVAMPSTVMTRAVPSIAIAIAWSAPSGPVIARAVGFDGEVAITVSVSWVCVEGSTAARVSVVVVAVVVGAGVART